MSPKPSSELEEANENVSNVENVEIANADRPNPRKEAPASVAIMTPEEREKAEKALVRKIDFRLLPMIIIMYILNYLDRNNIASARLAGLESDLGLVGNQYLVSYLLNFIDLLLTLVDLR